MLIVAVNRDNQEQYEHPKNPTLFLFLCTVHIGKYKSAARYQRHKKANEMTNSSLSKNCLLF